MPVGKVLAGIGEVLFAGIVFSGIWILESGFWILES